jgi:hypothetical protein
MKKIVKSALQIFITLILSLVFMEFTLNYTEIILPTFVDIDPEEGDVLEPNAEIAYFAEGFAINQVNSAGYWGPVYSVKKKPNIIRIALIGDSYVEALQVQPEFHFRTILENELSKTIGKKVEVLNFGRSGLSFREMYTTYEFRVKKYSPDYTLFFVQDQDFLKEGPQVGPQVFLNKNNKLEFTDFDRTEIYRKRKKWESLKDYSSYSLLRNVFKMIKSGESDEILLDKFDFLVSDDENYNKTDSSIYLDQDKFYDLNNAIYKQMKLYENSNKTKYLTVTIESMPNTYINLIKKYSSLIDLQPELEKFKNNTGIDPIKWDVTNTFGHWNYEGHRFVGEYLTQTIANLIADEKNVKKINISSSKTVNNSNK